MRKKVRADDELYWALAYDVCGAEGRGKPSRKSWGIHCRNHLGSIIKSGTLWSRVMA